MTTSQHPAAAEHLQHFITAPGETDSLLVIVALLLIGAILAGGVFFLWLHSLPERMVHNRIQFDIVAVLVLLSLFTHIHALWFAALLLALVKFPDIKIPNFIDPVNRIAESTEIIATNVTSPSPPEPTPSAASTSPLPVEKGI